MRREAEQIIENVIELTYFMRGAIGYEEMLFRTPGERQMIASFITRRLESQQKSMYPVY